MYWLLAGWWLGPMLWAGRVVLWLAFWPLGLWRSLRHHAKAAQRRDRRGRWS